MTWSRSLSRTARSGSSKRLTHTQSLILHTQLILSHPSKPHFPLLLFSHFVMSNEVLEEEFQVGNPVN